MAFQKFTTLQLNKDVRPFLAPMQKEGFSRSAKLSHFEFVPEPGFLYITTRAISSRVNANYDGWPPEELRKAYRSFVGRPVYVDHNNWDLERSRGVILDAKLHEDKLSSVHDDVWVELLIEVDAEAFPRLASAIIAGDIDAVSMGADVEFTVCSVCDNKAHDVLQYCAHIPQMKGQKVETLDKVAGKKIRKLCYEDCYGVSFFEISFVFDPADESALISDVMLAPKAANRTLAHIRNVAESVSDYSERVGTMSKTADKALISLPAPVDTLRDELNCPQCGGEWDGMVCASCGFELPPEGLGDPLSPAAMMGDQQEDVSEQPEDDSQEEDEGDEDESNAKKQKKADKEVNVSRFDDLQKQATLPQDPPYRQDTSPANSVPPYGEAIPGGTPVDGFEPALEPGQPAQAVVQDLDAPDVQGPIGQSAVQVVNEVPGPTDVPPPGSQAGEALNMGGGEKAAAVEKEADAVSFTDVRNLDEPPAVDVSADATLEVTRVIEAPEQLALADTTDVINDGGETGLPAGPNFRERLRDQINPFNDAALQGYNPVNQQVASVEDVEEEARRLAAAKAREDQRVNAAKTRVLRIASFVEERIELGLSKPDAKFVEIARFEEMDDATLDGFIQATKEFKSLEARTANKRIRVAASQETETAPARMPSLGNAPRVASAQEDDDDAMDYVAFL